MREQVWHPAFDRIDVLDPIVMIVDGGQGRVNVANNMADLRKGIHSGSTGPNNSGCRATASPK